MQDELMSTAVQYRQRRRREEEEKSNENTKESAAKDTDNIRLTDHAAQAFTFTTYTH
jgi:hypothetical protein